MSRMFPFITATHNLIPEAVCPYECCYCWSRAKGFMGRNVRPEIKEKRWAKRFGRGDFVFLNDLYDGMALDIGAIARVYAFVTKSPDATFLLMTKNPLRYLDLMVPKNCVLGATIETDYGYDIIGKFSKAPPPDHRIEAMKKLAELGKNPLFVSVEPILRHSNKLDADLIGLKPWAVAVGYDNYRHNLPEPSLAETNALIGQLRGAGIKVYEKTLRKAWWEEDADGQAILA